MIATTSPSSPGRAPISPPRRRARGGEGAARAHRAQRGGEPRQAKGRSRRPPPGWASTRASEQQARADIVAAESSAPWPSSTSSAAESLRQKEAISAGRARRASRHLRSGRSRSSIGRRRGSPASRPARPAPRARWRPPKVASRPRRPAPSSFDAARASVGVAEARVQQAQAALQIAGAQRLVHQDHRARARRGLAPIRRARADGVARAPAPGARAASTTCGSSPTSRRTSSPRCTAGQAAEDQDRRLTAAASSRGHVESISGGLGRALRAPPAGQRLGQLRQGRAAHPGPRCGSTARRSIALRPGMSAYVTVETRAH